MPDNIITERPDTATQLEREYADILANFRCRMTPRKADRYLGVKSNTIQGAIERREIEYLKVGGAYRVTPKALAEWLERFCTVKPDPLPS